MLEGIYRSSGVKSKVNKLRVAFNSRTCSGVNLNDYEPAVVASVLKLVNLFKSIGFMPIAYPLFIMRNMPTYLTSLFFTTLALVHTESHSENFRF